MSLINTEVEEEEIDNEVDDIFDDATENLTETEEEAALAEIDDDDEMEDIEEEEETSTTPSSPTVDLATLEKVAELMRGQQAPAQPDKPREFTPEEIDAALKVWRPSKEFTERLFNGEREEQEKALDEMVTGLTTHMTTMMSYALQAQSNQFQQTVQPFVLEKEKAQLATLTDEVATKYKGLEPYKSLVSQTILQLRAEGFVPKNQDDAFRSVAERVETIVKAVKPDFKLNESMPAPPKQQQQTKPVRPKMAGLQSGSGGGGGNTAKPKSTGKAFLDVFS